MDLGSRSFGEDAELVARFGCEMIKNSTIVFPNPGKVAIEEREVPSPGVGQLLIKTICTLISTGTELTILSGEFPKDSAWSNYGRFPFVAGYSNIGKIVEVGQGVSEEDWIGKKVASRGPHANFVLSTPEELTPIEDSIPEEEAAFFVIAEIAMNGIRRGNVTWGESVVVYGLGLVGQLTVGFSYLAGARPVMGIEIAKGRLDRLPKKTGIFGLNPEQVDLASRAKQLTNNRLADVVFEVTGNQKLIPEEFKLLKPQGRFVVLSSPRGATVFDFHDLCNSPSYTIIGAHEGSHPSYETPIYPWTQSRHNELFFRLVADKELDVASLITHRVPFNQATEIYEKLLTDRSEAMGVILEWQG